MTDPVNWHRRTDRRDGGPAVVFDLDGVISDATHRQMYLRREPKDWHGFFSAGADDPLIESGRALIGSVAPDHTVVILTARPAWMVQPTRDWLDSHGVRCDLLIMRPPDDQRPSADYKRDEIEVLRAAGYTISFAIDDDMVIVAMYRSHGVVAFYLHSGYYEVRDAEAAS